MRSVSSRKKHPGCRGNTEIRGNKKNESRVVKMSKRYQEIIKYETHIHQHGVLDTKTGEFNRFYDMENEETDRIQRERNIQDEKNYPEQMPKEGSVTIIREWD